MSAPLAVRWIALCDRLDVKPKQFATLIAVAAVSIGAFGAKAMLRPRQASADPEAAATEAAAVPGAAPQAFAGPRGSRGPAPSLPGPGEALGQQPDPQPAH